ncbi:MAG: hypothetical protein KQI62_00040 [Deltaproteobacteria bacterium]|nr:hypothetical protein [Deltaproteobacteria bacterium]
MPDQQAIPVVLGSGANAYGLVRSLYDAGLRSVVADEHRGPAFFSRLVAGRWLMPPLAQESRVAKALATRLANLGGQAFVIPTNEPWLHILNNSRSELGPNLCLPIAAPEVVDLALRKSAMHRWCSRHGVVQPDTMVFEPGQNWGDFLARAVQWVPVIIKPDTKGLGDQALGFSTAEFHGAQALRQWGGGWHPQGPPCTILAQRFLHGPQVQLSAWQGYRSPNGSLFMVGMSKLRSRPPRLGGCGAAWSYGAGRAGQQAAVDMLQALGYSGFFDLEFLVRSSQEPPVFIELNPRPGMPNYAATSMGLNLPWLALSHCRDQGPPITRIVTNRPGHWVDLCADPLLALTGNVAGGRRWTPGQWLRSLRPGPLVFAHFNWQDPLVFLTAGVRLAALGFQFAVEKSRASKSTSQHRDRPGKPTAWGGLKLRIKGFLDQAGTIGPAKMSFAVALNSFWRKYYFFQQDLQGPFVEPVPIRGLTWRRVQAQDAPLLAEINPAVSDYSVEQRLAKGQIGWLFFLEHKPVHFRWEATGTVFVYALGIPMALGPGDVSHVGGYTKREYRRMGISTFSRALLLAKARDRGYRRMIVGTRWWNRPSLRGCKEKSGLQPIGAAILWQLGPIRKLRTTGELALNHRGELYLKES